MPPQIEALEDYVDQSYGRNVAVLPLREPERRLGVNSDQGAAGEIDRDTCIEERSSTLIVEQIESAIPTEIFKARCDLVYEPELEQSPIRLHIAIYFSCHYGVR